MFDLRPGADRGGGGGLGGKCTPLGPKFRFFGPNRTPSQPHRGPAPVPAGGARSRTNRTT